MQLNPVASTVLVIFCVLALLCSVVLNFLLLFALYKANAVLEGYRSKVEPVLSKIDGFLDVAREKLVSIGERTEAILEQGEEMTASVHDRVEKTSAVVQHTVNAPLIGINSVWAGVSRGVRTFGSLQRDRIAMANDEKHIATATAAKQRVPTGK